MIGRSSLFSNRLISPLRYPGGKRWILPFVAQLLEATGGRRKLVVEPFTGGGSVTIGLLEAGFADMAVVNDLDPLVGAFWQVVFSDDARELADRVLATEVTLERWYALKKTPNEVGTAIDKAFRCLFLNRTSFSGILTDQAGPIGGASQGSEYDVGCRFNLQRVAARILELSRLSSRVAFRGNGTWQHLADHLDMNVYRTHGLRSEDVFWYVDPPFYRKADRLYRYWFDAAAHVELANFLRQTVYGRWLLSYDDNPEVENLYGNHPGFSTIDVEKPYNTAALKRKGQDRIKQARSKTREVVVSDLIAEQRRGNRKGYWSNRNFKVGKAGATDSELGDLLSILTETAHAA